MEDIDALVRRFDPDRWLASRFITDAQARADVIALYAFDYELSRVAKVTSQAIMGEIRLTWWADAIAEIFEGRPVRRHPVTLALAEAIARHGLRREPFDAVIDAYFPELDGQPADAKAAAYAVMSLAQAILGGRADIEAAAEAWASRSTASLAKVNRDLSDMPAQAFPAVAYVTLVRAPSAGPLSRRLRVGWSVLRGRL